MIVWFVYWITNKRKNSMEQCPPEADSYSASQEVLRLLWN